MNTKNLKDRLGGKVEALQTEPQTEAEKELNTKTTEGRVIPMPGTALTPVNSDYIALKNNAIEIINENLKNQPLSYQLFDIIKSPSGGATTFTVPTLSGDESRKELTGIILDYSMPRAYWDTPDPVEGTPPVCYSRDSIISYPDGKVCARCTFNDFGSKNGGDTQAKACKEYVLIVMLQPDNIMPIIVRVPVSSKLFFQRYMTRLIRQMLSISGVVTKITLEKKTNKTGQPYAQYNFEAASVLESEEAASAKAFGRQFMEILNAADEPFIDDEPVIKEAV
jgi:hypothetical protein